MKKEEVNNISKELLAFIPELKKGESAIYELIGGVNYTVVNEDNTRGVQRVFPAIQQIINKTTIFDRGHDEMIKIGNVTAPGTKDKDPRFGAIEFKATNASRIVVSDAKTERTLYHFLELHPENQDCVNPDNTPPAGGYTFRRVKPEATAQEKLNLKLLKNRAAATIEIFGEGELIELAKNFGIDSTKSEAEIKLALHEIAETERGAKTILNREVNSEVATNALLEDAQKHKIIVFDSEENQWNWVETGNKIIGQFSGEPLETLKKYMAETDAGEKFQTNLKKAVAGAHTKKKK